MLEAGAPDIIILSRILQEFALVARPRYHYSICAIPQFDSHCAISIKHDPMLIRLPFSTKQQILRDILQRVSLGKFLGDYVTLDAPSYKGRISVPRSVRVSHGPVVSIVNRYLTGLILPRPHSQQSSFTLIQPRLTPKHQENAEHQSRDTEHCEIPIMKPSLRTAAIDLNSLNLILAGQNSSPDETSIASLDVRDLVQAENCLRKIENRQRNQRAQFTTNSSRMNCWLSCVPHGPNHRCDARATAYADRAITRRRNGATPNASRT